MYYSNKSNAKRATIKSVATANNLPLDLVKANINELFDFPKTEGQGFQGVPTSNMEKIIASFGLKKTPAKAKHVMPTAKELLAKANAEAKAKSKLENTVAKKAPVVQKETVNRIKIEKNRAQANGIKRPSAGTICCDIWDFCDHLIASGVVPNAKSLRNEGVNHNWERNTMSTQAYYWRIFHGYNKKG